MNVMISSVLVLLVFPFVLMKDVIKIGYITGSKKNPNGEFHRRFGQAISGALSLALEEVNNDTNILPNHTLEFVVAETYGSELYSVKVTVDLINENISAYIGPQDTCRHEAKIAAAFNIPMISYFCSDVTVSNDISYPTFARTTPVDSQISRSVVSILKKFGWNKVTFVHTSENELQHPADTIYQSFLEYGIEVTFRMVYKGPYFHFHTENPFVKIVQDSFVDTRIYVMLAQSYEFVGLMDHLKDRGLLDSGEYFVVGVHVGQYKAKDPKAYFKGIFTSNSEYSEQAFRYFIGIVHSPPVYPWFDTFTTVVNNYLEMPPWNYTNHFRDVGGMKIIPSEAAYLYDAVWLYARAVHKAIKDAQNYRNGTLLIDLVKRQTYNSAMGYKMRINALGDSEGNYSLIAHGRGKVHSGEESIGMYPVGVFQMNENLTALPSLKFYEGKGINWENGAPPVDEPSCGFRGERCIPAKRLSTLTCDTPGEDGQTEFCEFFDGLAYTKEILGGVAGGLFLVISIIAFFAYRNWKYENDLASLLWKIDYKDITFQSQFTGCMGTGRSAMGRRTGMVRVNSQASLASAGEVDFRQLFTSVATFKGNIVAVKKVNKKCVELTRNIKKELKVVRDLRHDNVNPFIGACIDDQTILVVSSYCAKGSLQDILENDDIQLDTMFKASLLFDIIRGMIYLHESELKYHGRLKSSNCVVDSRWVLKITDYGLHEFLQGPPDENEGEFAKYRNMLWKAPEILRQEQSSRGTPEGDIYSFAVIMYEIHGRNGPFGDIDLSPKEIIERVQSRDLEIPFRPWLGALTTTPQFIIDVIKDCWNEDMTKRPDFKVIRHRLKPMQKGMKSNILDNMMAIMERYASNLEALVEERTDQLREEKKKTEDLLHSMLPKYGENLVFNPLPDDKNLDWSKLREDCRREYLIEQLKLGKEVEAEWFDCVTIYFSDICGFTALSADSTPMQVVALLNDLYTVFDSIVEHYDVYKVETIGDAYMVVSGLPKRNGILHAGEIASMSLHLLRAIMKFKIRHRPDDTIKLRIGLHSGPCVAGVVGLKMPRYCLFGDTVNTASRMESNGLPLKIHCSIQTKELLDRLTGYSLEERGLVSMKGKGEVLTYWLCKEDRLKRLSRLETHYSITCSPEHSADSVCDTCRVKDSGSSEEGPFTFRARNSVYNTRDIESELREMDDEIITSQRDIDFDTITDVEGSGGIMFGSHVNDDIVENTIVPIETSVNMAPPDNTFETSSESVLSDCLPVQDYVGRKYSVKFKKDDSDRDTVCDIPRQVEVSYKQFNGRTVNGVVDTAHRVIDTTGNDCANMEMTPLLNHL